ncbi:hypothetical protein ACMFMF_008722 [Clarireedia jacksonii]
MGEHIPEMNNFQILKTFLHNNPTIKFVQYQYLDYSSILCTKFLTKTFALNLASSNKPVTAATFATASCLIDGSPAPENWGPGEDQLWPDYSTLRVLHYLPGHASMMCHVHEGNLNEGVLGFVRDPRHRLIQLLEEVKEEQGVEFLVGHEIEFFICEPPTADSVPTKPVHTDKLTGALSCTRNRYLSILEEIVTILMDSGVAVREFHAEGNSGFFEISLDPLPPVQSVDELMYARETIRTICSKHGLYATMHPKPFERHAICGSHVHLSLSRKEPEIEDSFFAGVLRSWGGLAAVYMSNYDSYERVREGEWVSWGWKSRNHGIRKINTAHWEFRHVDATANGYMVLLGLISAGLMGLRERLEMEIKDSKRWALEPIDWEEARTLGYRDRMPQSLREALDRLRVDCVMREGLGVPMLERYVGMKIREAEVFKKMNWAERRNVSIRYF